MSIVDEGLSSARVVELLLEGGVPGSKVTATIATLRTVVDEMWVHLSTLCLHISPPLCVSVCVFVCLSVCVCVFYPY